MLNTSSSLLSHASFSILLALSLKPRHGYGLLQQIKQDSLGILQFGPGTLYGTLQQLREQHLIEEVPSELTAERRRLYRLTKKGWDRLGDELSYYQNIPLLARERKVITTPHA